jgi:dimethylhistidine N-methyltransferase
MAQGLETPAAQIVVQRVDTHEERRQELAAGLLQAPASIAPKFFYDAQGCALYGAICELQEYYPPRAEAAIFDRYQAEIAGVLPRQAQFVDLGCGDGMKARRWIAALQVRRYIGVDIAEAWLRDTLQRGARECPGVQFDGVVTDFTRGLQLHKLLRRDTPRIFFYPGSSIGNFHPAQATALLREVREHLGPGDRLLIGVDTPKDRARLVAAYDDALGVTAAFNLNVLRVANRELGSDFHLHDFMHRALFNEVYSRVEMHLVARHAVTVRLGGHGERRFAGGEAIVTEHSYKYRAEVFAQLLADAGFADVRHWTDDGRDFGVFVAAPGDGR